MTAEADLRAGRLLEATERDDFGEVAAVLSEIDRSGTTTEDAVTLIYAREYARENDRPGLREFADSGLEVEKGPGMFGRVLGAIIGSEAGFWAGSEIPDLGVDLPFDDLADQLLLPELALGFAGVYAGWRVGSRFDSPGRTYRMNEDMVRERLSSSYDSSGDALPFNTEKLRERLYRDHGIDLYADVEG